MPTEIEVQKAIETLREAGVCVVLSAKIYGWVERRPGHSGPAYFYDNEVVGVKVEVNRSGRSTG